jgi:hypothetical protein
VWHVNGARIHVPRCGARWPTSDLDTRKFVLLRFPYAVIYNERKSVVRILPIAHGHPQPGYWKDRL